MHVICSYCSRYIKENKPFHNKEITHGICLDCFVPTSMLTAGSYSYDEYLETFNVPTLILDTNLNVLAVNKLVPPMLQKPFECLIGILPGDALECSNSKLPGGCSGTTSCETCTIRSLILKTMHFGISYHYECVALETERGKSNFLVSTLFYDNVIQIVFEDSRINEVEVDSSCSIEFNQIEQLQLIGKQRPVKKI